jgi:hypothetical protein
VGAIVDVDVIGTVIVDVHGNGNDTVGVIVPHGRTGCGEEPRRSKQRIVKRSSTGWITIRVSFTFPCTATITDAITSTPARDHDNGQDRCIVVVENL